MQIAFHIGAHCTDDERLLKSLLKDADSFRELGVQIPGPGKYGDLLRDTIAQTRDADPAPGTRESLIEKIADDAAVRRLILVNPTFLCFLNRIFEKQLFYHTIDEKLGAMRRIFAQDELSYFMGMRNLAVFLPMAISRQKDMDYHSFIHNADLDHLRWSHVAERLRRADPQAQITVWAHEDTPYIWGHLIRAVAGVEPQTRISGGYDMVQDLLSDAAMADFVAHMRQNPPQTEAARREIIGQFLQTRAQAHAQPMEIDLPGWDQALVDRLTAHYYEDLEKIAAMPGVRLIAA